MSEISENVAGTRRSYLGVFTIRELPQRLIQICLRSSKENTEQIFSLPLVSIGGGATSMSRL